jgi:hypothetical protein
VLGAVARAPGVAAAFGPGIPGATLGGSAQNFGGASGGACLLTHGPRSRAQRGAAQRCNRRLPGTLDILNDMIIQNTVFGSKYIPGTVSTDKDVTAI